MRQRSAFSLLEVIICVAIISVVAAELSMMLVGLFRLQKEHLWNAELTDRLRAARERMLFHAVSPDNTYTYGGLLSATNMLWTSGQLQAVFPRTKLEAMGGFDVKFEDVQGGRYTVTKMDDGNREVLTQGGFVTNDLAFVSISVNVDGSNRVERLSIPMFGKKANNLWAEFMQAVGDNCGNAY